ncbi:glycosyltransferase involved in cell wall biosynthesis [Amorphus suaedae]
MTPDAAQPRWKAGTAPVAVVMISFNEAHNMTEVLDNLAGWAEEVFLVDSFSNDETVDIALSRGVTVVQRAFTGFGDQWNFAARKLPFKAPWTMKLDPDERLTPELKAAIEQAITADAHDALILRRRLWFMGRPLSIRQDILRLWRTGTCRFADVAVNEHPLVEGAALGVAGDLEHHDSPSLHRWVEKQNRYTTAEAIAGFRNDALSVTPRLLGSSLERRMWLKRVYWRAPFRHQAMYLFCLFGQGAWRSGRSGFIWARLRVMVFRMIEDKRREMEWRGEVLSLPPVMRGAPHPGAIQAGSVDRGAHD